MYHHAAGSYDEGDEKGFVVRLKKHSLLEVMIRLEVVKILSIYIPRVTV